MKLDDIVPEGMTALGPALAIALGIISKHGPGSTIMAITDGNSNKGILSSSQDPKSNEKIEIETISRIK